MKASTSSKRKSALNLKKSSKTLDQPKKGEEKNPKVGIIMGSISDLETMQAAADILKEFKIPFEMKVVSAHRTPLAMVEYACNAKGRGLEVIIAGAGGAAHLPGMVASLTPLPVIGVPVQSKALKGLDSLLSIVQMPAGVPVATMAIGNAKNAGLLAARILGISNPIWQGKVTQHMASMEAEVLAMKIPTH
jgi:5-(carboxyamino)imidazole ribonucleotide mutase